jgi:hypothetical protein
MADRGAPVCCDGGGGGYVMQVGAAAKSASAAVNDLERFGHRTGVTGLWNAGPGGRHGGGRDLSGRCVQWRQSAGTMSGGLTAGRLAVSWRVRVGAGQSESLYYERHCMLLFPFSGVCLP